MTIASHTQQATLSAVKQELLAKRRRGLLAKPAEGLARIPRRSSGGPAPLSYPQQPLWFIHQLDQASPAYNMPICLRLVGDLDISALEGALRNVIRRHEVLRSTFISRDGVPEQVVGPEPERVLELVEFPEFPAGERKARVGAWLNEEARKPFDLAQAPLLRCFLIKLDAREHLLSLVMHHIVSDGWSVSILCRELSTTYHALREGREPDLPELPIQYSDFAAWSLEWLTPERLAPHLQFWKKHLAGAPTKIKLPTDYEAPSQTAMAGDTQSVLLKPEFGISLNAFAQAENTTPFAVLTSGLLLLLQKWCGQSDLVLGTVVAARSRRELEPLIGCFMNFLPMRCNLAQARTVRDVLHQARQTILDTYSHQDCPFEKVVEAINPSRRPEKNPLFNVGLLLQNYPGGLLAADGLEADFVPVDTQTALLDLRFVLEEKREGFALACEFDVDLFEPGTIRNLLLAYQSMLETIVQSPEAELHAIQLGEALQSQARAVHSRDATQFLTVAANFTAEPLEDSLRFWMKELGVSAQIQFAPYNQLFQQLLNPTSLLRANDRGVSILLIRLEDLGRSPDDALNGHAQPPAELSRHAHELISAVHKAAAEQPRISWLVCLCPASPAVLERPAWRQTLSELEASFVRGLEPRRTVHVIRPAEVLDLYPVPEYDDPSANRLGHVPYTPVFFTALGTFLARKFHALKRAPKKVIALDCDNTLWTGICGEDGPMGIAVEPARVALQHFMKAQRDAGMLLCLCSKNNEPDVDEVFSLRSEMPLCPSHIAARRVNWLPKSENLRSLARELNLGLDSFILVDDNPVECAEVEAGATQVLAIQLPEATASLPRFLRHVWAFDHLKITEEDRQRGERYEQNRIRQQLLASATSLADFVAGLNLVINIAPATREHLPRIAQLTQRTNQFNCTTRRRSDGEIEQLFVSGKAEILAVHVTDRFGDYGLVGVMIYTADREAITADTFLLSCRALGKGVEHRMLAFLGESAAKRGLRRVDVPFKATAKNQPALEFLSSIGAAYHQGHDGKSVFRFPADFAAAVRFEPHAAANTPLRGNSKASDANSQPGNTTEDWLPEYKRYGWIARNAYDAIQIQQLIELQAALRQTSTDAPYEAPRSKLETELCDLWRQLLRVERVGIHDDFFTLGGTSLLAVRMIAELEKLTGRKLPLVTVFRTPSIAQIAQSLDQKSGASGNRSAVVAIQSKGSRPPLFLVHGAGGGILWGYANLAAYLGGDQPVYGLDPGQPNLASQPTVEQMAAAYVRDIRTIQPVGPYYLGGYCFGGYVAYEMARQLTEQGQAIGLLALIDSAAPNGPYERVPWWSPAFYPRFMRNSLYWLQDFRQLPPDTRREFFRRKLDVLRRKVAGRLRPLRGNSPEIILEEYIDTTQFPEHERQLWQMHLTAGAQYIPKPFAGRVTLLRTHGQPLLCSLDPHYGWRELARDGVDVRLVPGAHENIFVEPEVQTLAAELSAALNGAQAKAPSPQLS